MSGQNISVKARVILNDYGEDIALEDITLMLNLFEEAGLDTIVLTFRELLEELYKITGRPRPTDTIH